MDYIWHYNSPLGGMTMASDGQALIGLWFDGQKHFGEVLDNGYEECFLPVFDQTCRWLAIYFSGKVPDFMPAISLRASAFRKRVLKILLTIPYGQTMTYGQIAARLAQESGMERMSAQAVGTAVGHNPISIIIPCHRVTWSAGRPGGYAAGLNTKSALLQLERVLHDELAASGPV